MLALLNEEDGARAVPAVEGELLTDGSTQKDVGRARSGMVKALYSPATVLARHFELIWALVERDIESRIRGTVLGKVWIVFGPLFMLSVYALVFGLILDSRWQEHTGEAFLFPLIYFSGLILFNLFFESIARAANLLRENEAFVTKIVFPLEALCFAVVGSSLVRFAIGIVILAVFYVPLRGLPPAAALAYPALLLGLMLFALGGTLALAAIGVFVRDLTHLMQPLSMLLLFLSPLFYPLDRVPAGLQPLVMLNPLAYPLEATRNALFFGAWPSPVAVAVYLGLGWAAAVAGQWLFRRLQPGFADVL